MSAQKPGLRERKAAATRLAIARALAQRLTTRSLGEITADELAEAAGVSRMTLFNYFPTKEHIVDQIFAIWLYEEQCASRRLELRGVARILHLFQTFGELTAESPARARMVAAWFAARPFDRPPPELTRADRELIAPDLAEHPLLMGRDAWPQAIAEARALGEIDSPSSDYELGHLLGVLLFGTPLVGHSTPDLDWVEIYLHHGRCALGLDAGPKKRPKKTKNEGR